MGDKNSFEDKLGQEGKPLEADFNTDRFKRAGSPLGGDFPDDVRKLAGRLQGEHALKAEQEQMREFILPQLTPEMRRNAKTLPRAIKMLVKEKETNQKTLDRLVKEQQRTKKRYTELFDPLVKQTENQATTFFGNFRRNYHIMAKADLYLTRAVNRFKARMGGLTKVGPKNGDSKSPFTKDAYNVSFDPSKGEVVCKFKTPAAAFHASVILHQLENDEVDETTQRYDQLAAVLKEEGMDETKIEDLQEKIKTKLDPLKAEGRKDDDVARRLLKSGNSEGLIAMYVDRGTLISELHEKVEEEEDKVEKAAERQILIIDALQERLKELSDLLMDGDISFSILPTDEPVDSVKGKYKLNLSILNGIESAIREIMVDKEQAETDLAKSKSLRGSDLDKYRDDIQKIQSGLAEETGKWRKYITELERENEQLKKEKEVSEEALKMREDYFTDILDKHQSLLGINTKLAERLGKATGKGAVRYKHKVKEESKEIKAVMSMLKDEVGKLKFAIKDYAALMAKQKGVNPKKIESEFTYLRLNPDPSEEVIHVGPKMAEVPETLESIILNHKLILTDFSAAVGEIEKALGRINKQYGDLIENLPKNYRLSEGESVLLLRKKFSLYKESVEKSDLVYKKAILEFNKEYQKILRIQYAGWDGNGELKLRLGRLNVNEPAANDSELIVDLSNYEVLKIMFDSITGGSEGVSGLKTIEDMDKGIENIKDYYKAAFSREAALRDLVELVESKGGNEEAKNGLFGLVKEIKPSVKSRSESLAYAKEALGKIDEVKKYEPKLSGYKDKLVDWTKERFSYTGNYEGLRNTLNQAVDKMAKIDKLAKENTKLSEEERVLLAKFGEQADELMSKGDEIYFNQLEERQNYLIEVFGKAVGQELSSLDDVKAIMGNVGRQHGVYLEPNKETEKSLAEVRKRFEKEIKAVHESNKSGKIARAQEMMENLYKK